MGSSHIIPLWAKDFDVFKPGSIKGPQLPRRGTPWLGDEGRSERSKSNGSVAVSGYIIIPPSVLVHNWLLFTVLVELSRSAKVNFGGS